MGIRLEGTAPCHAPHEGSSEAQKVREKKSPDGEAPSGLGRSKANPGKDLLLARALPPKSSEIAASEPLGDNPLGESGLLGV